MTAIQPGENVPQNVELQAIPAEVTRRIPELQAHRYLLAEDDVVVVHSQEPRIVAIIERQ